ncbi:DUF805 domain-containing protein [Microvirga sp. GCM10011540]|uniref:DUF805 domain-containing protein n=1 Tax=Microvirga sp. GCM10011540 TaxID=3317338 RepID=UPI003615F116
MNYLRLFFSFFGRIRRTVYWGGLVFNILAFLTVFFIADSIVLKSGGHLYAQAFKKCLLISAVIALTVSALSLHVRRARDRGLNGWWGALGFGVVGLSGWWIGHILPTMLKDPMYLLPASPALAALAFVLFQFGVIRGPNGSNESGPDPRVEDAMEEMRLMSRN